MVEVMFPSHERDQIMSSFLLVKLQATKKMNTTWRQFESNISLNSTNKIYRALTYEPATCTSHFIQIGEMKCNPDMDLSAVWAGREALWQILPFQGYASFFHSVLVLAYLSSIEKSSSNMRLQHHFKSIAQRDNTSWLLADMIGFILTQFSQSETSVSD